ncbi:MAG: U32 family peptidase [Planctomycetes bacterium]|nr:U32 family peptidase [Planctomycetota bacterium]
MRRKRRRGLHAPAGGHYYSIVRNPAASTPELLAPAGDWEALRAAAASGADAVYFGLTKYSARRRATNFTPAELPDVMAYLRGRNVRGYVALNTLIFSDELAEAADLVAGVAAAGADAVIVQDLGLARLIRRMAPTLPVHASTQMTLTEPRGIEFVRRLGVARVILARELSLAEIRRIRRAAPVPLEVFVHGAMCISYSGQCLASEALWGRSANRGLCAQACRLPYRLLADGRPQDLGDRFYLLSTRDLAAHDRIAELVQLGIAALKIEGRLKDAAYVAAATQAYRAAIDAALQGRPFRLPREQAQALAQSYSRGFTHGFLDGPHPADLVDGRSPKSRGLRIGTVAARTAGGVLVQLDAARPRAAGGVAGEVAPGDGVVFDDGGPPGALQGGRVFRVDRTGTGRLLLAFGRGDVDLAAVPVGSTVWKTDDPRLQRELAKSCAREAARRRAPISVSLHGGAGGPLNVTVEDEAGNRAEVAWPGPLQQAARRPLTGELVREQFGRLGDTPFQLGAVHITDEGGRPVAAAPVMVPKSILNDLRRQAVGRLVALREENARHAVADAHALDALRAEVTARHPPDPALTPAAPAMCILVRSLGQLEAVLAWQPGEGLARPALVYCDFHDGAQYTDAVARLRAARTPAGLATPRVAKPDEEQFLRPILDARPDAVLVRHLGAVEFFREHAPGLPLVADFSLNAANEIAADLLLRTPAIRITPSLDLSRAQLAAMTGRFSPERLEPVVHLHVPMMYMEYCMSAARLARGRARSACGRPCREHRLALQDRIGAEHPFLADARCGSTLYSARVQSAIQYVPGMARAGVRHFRIEFLTEDRGEAHAILDLYAAVTAGRLEPDAAYEQLNRLTPRGVRRGTWDFE